MEHLGILCTAGSIFGQRQDCKDCILEKFAEFFEDAALRKWWVQKMGLRKYIYLYCDAVQRKQLEIVSKIPFPSLSIMTLFAASLEDIHQAKIQQQVKTMLRLKTTFFV